VREGDSDEYRIVLLSYGVGSQATRPVNAVDHPSLLEVDSHNVYHRTHSSVTGKATVLSEALLQAGVSIILTCWQAGVSMVSTCG
jgi:hypothetical protein